MSLESVVLAYFGAHLLCYLVPSAEYLICVLRVQALPAYAAVQVGAACCQTFQADTRSAMRIRKLMWTLHTGVCSFCLSTRNPSDVSRRRCHVNAFPFSGGDKFESVFVPFLFSLVVQNTHMLHLLVYLFILFGAIHAGV